MKHSLDFKWQGNKDIFFSTFAAVIVFGLLLFTVSSKTK